MMVNKNDSAEFPKGWAWTTIKEICNLINGRAFKPNEWSSEGLPIIRIQNLNDNSKSFNHCDFEVEKKYHVNNGDLLFAWSGTPGTSFGAHIWCSGKAVLNQHIFKVTIGDKCLNKVFIMHLINNNIDEYIGKSHGTAGLAHITKGKFENSAVALPPFPEQHRIVTKIEELFTKLDAGVEALKKIKAQLKRYRQAVLKHAFEGKLTEEWRKEHAAVLEPASVLLEKIKQERKTQLGKKYKELPPVDTTELPELPNEWERTRIGNISNAIQYGTSEKAIGDATGIPVVRMGNIQNGKLIFENLKYFPKNWSKLNDYILQDGDVLFNRTNSAELVGKTAVYKKPNPKAVFASYLIKVKVYKNAYIPDMLSFYINSHYGRQYIASVVSQQVGQANVNGRKLSLMPIPLLSFNEQLKIVEEIERRFFAADEIEKTINLSLQQADRLRQSILKRAFEGKLVPQDPDDEPAEKLLERIKAEKEKHGAEKTTRRKAKKGK